MRVTSVTQQIKNFALTQARMAKVGIAGIDRFNESPEGMHPTDFLPGCKSVIAFCVRLPEGGRAEKVELKLSGDEPLWKQEGERLTVEVPRLSYWDMVKITLAKRGAE